MELSARKFFAANRKVCIKITPHLPQAKNIFNLYDKTVAQYMNSRTGQTIADVGGGKASAFAKLRDPSVKSRIVAVDISEEEMRSNAKVDEKRVADVMRGLPFNPEEVDIIAAKSVLEHLASVETFVANSKQALRKEGYLILLFPSRFAPFALINRALPNTLAKKVLYFVHPATRDVSGFPALYDECCYSDIVRLLAKYDFEIVDVHLSYYQSVYFSFFIPLYLVSALYEMLIQAFKAKNLCAHVLIVARKK